MELILDKFKPTPHCVKCGSYETKINLLEQGWYFHQTKERECLGVTCSNCNFFWHMETKDFKEA